jgi:hypothetical protein
MILKIRNIKIRQSSKLSDCLILSKGCANLEFMGMVICLFQQNQLIDFFIILTIDFCHGFRSSDKCVMHSLPNHLKDVMHNKNGRHWIPILTF